MSFAAGPDTIGRGHPRVPGRLKPWLWGTSIVAVLATAGYLTQPRDPAPRRTERPQGWSKGQDLRMAVHAAASAAPTLAPPPDVALPDPPAPPGPPRLASEPEVPLVYTWAAAPSGNRSPPRRTGSATPGTNAAAAGTSQDSFPEGSEIGRRMQASSIATFTPAPDLSNPLYTLAEDTEFDCLASEPIDSRMVGPVSCIVQGNVYSRNGLNVLIPDASRVHGVIDRGLDFGEARLWINWTYAVWPKPYQVKLPLRAAGADPMGQMGVPGDLQQHLWEKAKPALVGSLIDFIGGAAGSALGAAVGGGTQIFNFGQPVQRSTSVAQMLAAPYANIRPSITRGPARMLKVRVMGDIDYSRILQNVVVGP